MTAVANPDLGCLAVPHNLLADFFRVSEKISVHISSGSLVHYSPSHFVCLQGQFFPTRSIEEILKSLPCENLKGEFALIVYDHDSRKLCVVRDRMGTIPLYYFGDGDHLYLSSEIRPFLRLSNFKVNWDEEALANLMVPRLRETRASHRTCFSQIQSIPPAHVLTFTNGKVLLRRYWEPRQFPVTDCFGLLKDRFEEAVQRRIDENPIGVAVSGGIDSSAIYSEVLKRIPQRTQGFSITWRSDSPESELNYLNELGPGIEKIPYPFNGEMECYSTQVRVAESPSLDILGKSVFALLEASRARGISTLLTGHWGDQVLYQPDYLFDRLKLSYFIREWRQLKTAMGPTYARYLFRTSLSRLLREYLPRQVHNLLRNGRDQLSDRIFIGGEPEIHPRGTHTRSKHSLLEYLSSVAMQDSLEWNHKIGHHFGVRMRFPFLDSDLVEACLSIPSEKLAWNGVPKGLFREVMRGTLPERILNRKTKADFTEVTNQIVSGIEVPQLYTDWSFVNSKRIRSQHRLGDKADCGLSWQWMDLFGLHLWKEQFFKV